MKLKIHEPAKALWKHHKKIWSGCIRCEIGHHAHNTVLGSGELPCDVLYVGDAPGKSDDTCGEPFVGESSSMLNLLVVQTMCDCPPHTIAMMNVLGCRPCCDFGGKTRRPNGNEIMRCRDRVRQMISMADPKMIVCVGHYATVEIEKHCDGTHGMFNIPFIKIASPVHLLNAGGVESIEYGRACDALISFITEQLK